MTIEIKPVDQSNLRKVNIKEWANVDAYIRNITSIERMIFNDLVFTYSDKEQDEKTRARSAAKAAIMVVSDKDGKPLFDQDSIEDLTNASFDPIPRIIAMTFDPDFADKSFRKN